MREEAPPAHNVGYVAVTHDRSDAQRHFGDTLAISRHRSSSTRDTVQVTAFAMRSARNDDSEGIARAHSAAWRAAFTFLPETFLEALTPDAVVSKWRRDLADPASSLFVATRGEWLGGFLQLAHANAEVMSLYVDPSVWRIGVGSMLLTYGESILADRGEPSALLWTARDSSQSRRFYERHGWVPTGREQRQTLTSGVVLDEVEYTKALA